MAVISLSVIDKNNKPLYVREFDQTLSADLMSEEQLFGFQSIEQSEEAMNIDSMCCSPRHQFVMHAALDKFEQLAGPLPGYGWRNAGINQGMFVGYLCPIEDLRVYCYVLTTRIKILLVVEDDAVPEMQPSIDNEIKALLTKIHALYIEYLLSQNFKEIGSVIVSKRFDRLVYQHISDFNQSEGMI
jgi:hypothetical protein